MNEIYHDDSLGAKINVVLVRIIMLGYGKVRPDRTQTPAEKATKYLLLKYYSLAQLYLDSQLVVFLYTFLKQIHKQI